ncbi:MAG: hypothetical protein AB1631_19840 [Acidobacteriota bacterium]
MSINESLSPEQIEQMFKDLGLDTEEQRAKFKELAQPSDFVTGLSFPFVIKVDSETQDMENLDA